MSQSQAPISPVSTSNPQFSKQPHQPNPTLTVSPPALNNEPVELEGTPLQRPSERIKEDAVAVNLQRRGSQAQVLESMSPREREEREKTIQQRKDDPAILVDIPMSPGAEEFRRVNDADAGHDKYR